jgi:peptide/nickel transport system permease protein
MANYLVRRLGQGVLTILIVTIIVFFLVNAAPGGPGSIMRPDMTAGERHALTIKMGLDKPLVTRYLEWLGSALHGDLGTSLSNNLPVWQETMQRLSATAELTLFTLLISVVLGVVLGIISARRPGKLSDYAIGLLSVAGLSVPVFWFAIVLILVFSVDLHWLPSSGMSQTSNFDLHDRFVHLLMPTAVLALTTLPNIIRFTRSSVIEVLSQDYMRTAKAKGLGALRLVYLHALPNALIPIISTVGYLIPRLLGGAVITETIFGWPGMGQLMFQSASSRDYPMIMGLTVVMAIIVVLMNILVDVLYSMVDPRVRTV